MAKAKTDRRDCEDRVLWTCTVFLTLRDAAGQPSGAAKVALKGAAGAATPAAPRAGGGAAGAAVDAAGAPSADVASQPSGAAKVAPKGAAGVATPAVLRAGGARTTSRRRRQRASYIRQLIEAHVEG